MRTVRYLYQIFKFTNFNFFVSRVLADQTTHPDTLEENLNKLDRLCNLAARYWDFCKRKSDELAECRLDVCHLESILETPSVLDCSFNTSFEVSQLDLSGVA